jgi:phosphohistidine phosphatase SixA
MLKVLSVCFVLVLSAVSLSQDHDGGIVFLVRHAEKASQEPNASLSDKGRKRAECLAGVLRDAGVTAIYVSEFIRTQQTAAPLAKQMGVSPTVIAAGDPDSLVSKLESNATSNVLVVGHSDTIPKIIQRLSGKIFSMDDAEYDKLFVLRETVHDSPVVLRYCDCE